MIRITTGIYKRMHILMPEGIRPTQDKVRKALFDILGDIEGLSFLELFAGSGAVGFEAVSRGAGELVLVEQNRACISVIKKNIELLKLDESILFSQDVDKAVKTFHTQGKVFDLIFMDPPYSNPHTNWSIATDIFPIGVGAKKTLQTLGAYDILSPNGFIIVEHFKKDALPQEQDKLVRFKEAKYSDTLLSFYKKCAK
ncbi:MAG: 16S rRNA (guanine(966)-N(2))-methyltransferase RsmD [Candidatus Omnitrophica bacterium]|nr:16S rRNA (guanine(966)-N(2))-methyltransferase RsmD [Candidatus Omnitrophota bacterium]